MSPTHGRYNQATRDKIAELLKKKGELGSGDVAEKLGMTMNQARHFLMMMTLEGKVKSRRVGRKRGFMLWSSTEEG